MPCWNFQEPSTTRTMGWVTWTTCLAWSIPTTGYLPQRSGPGRKRDSVPGAQDLGIHCPVKDSWKPADAVSQSYQKPEHCYKGGAIAAIEYPVKEWWYGNFHCWGDDFFNILSAPENIKTIIRNIIHLLCHFLIDLTKIKKQASIADNKKILIK